MPTGRALNRFGYVNDLWVTLAQACGLDMQKMGNEDGNRGALSGLTS